jgi:hypothetical protein
LEGPEGLGGDIEVFAVRGKHHTPWHFDAQENFTVQCTGTKRWRLARGAADAPLTNLHPASSNAAALADDVLTHCASGWAPQEGGGGGDVPPPPGAVGEVVSVLLRPGSTLYVPAGWWHCVDAEGEGGSVSINFSVGGARWGDVLLRALSQRLWREPGWRARVAGMGAGGGEVARAQLGALLAALPAVVGELTPEALLPAAAAAEGGGCEGGGWRVTSGAAVEPPLTAPPTERPATALRRNGIAHLTVEPGAPRAAVAFSVRSLFATGGFADAKVSGGFQFRVEVPAALRPCVARLAALGCGEAVGSTESLAREAEGASPAAVESLLRVLQHVGYLL